MPDGHPCFIHLDRYFVLDLSGQALPTDAELDSRCRVPLSIIPQILGKQTLPLRKIISVHPYSIDLDQYQLPLLAGNHVLSCLNTLIGWTPNTLWMSFSTSGNTCRNFRRWRFSFFPTLLYWIRIGPGISDRMMITTEVRFGNKLIKPHVEKTISINRFIFHYNNDEFQRVSTGFGEKLFRFSLRKEQNLFIWWFALNTNHVISFPTHYFKR